MNTLFSYVHGKLYLFREMQSFGIFSGIGLYGHNFMETFINACTQVCHFVLAFFGITAHLRRQYFDRNQHSGYCNNYTEGKKGTRKRHKCQCTNESHDRAKGHRQTHSHYSLDNCSVAGKSRNDLASSKFCKK